MACRLDEAWQSVADAPMAQAPQASAPSPAAAPPPAAPPPLPEPAAPATMHSAPPAASAHAELEARAAGEREALLLAVQRLHAQAVEWRLEQQRRFHIMGGTLVAFCVLALFYLDRISCGMSRLAR